MNEQLNENLTKEQMKETLGDLADYLGKTFPDWNVYCQAVQIFIEHGQFQKQLATISAERDAAVKLLGEVGAPISYWFVTNMGQCLYCNANETPAGIPHNPDCLVIRISALLAKEATE